MRVISQDGAVDVPYETGSFNMIRAELVEPKRTNIYCHHSSIGVAIKIAEYSAEAKAIKAMEMLREAYIGMPIVMQNVDISDDVAKEFERLKKCGIMVQIENQPSKADFINNAVFRFPQDDEIEV